MSLESDRDRRYTAASRTRREIEGERYAGGVTTPATDLNLHPKNFR
jgi:hypothetical protein